MADDVVFSAAWGAAVHDFISDPVNAEEARQRGHGLNYGDFIEFGVEHLERHGLRRVDEPYGQHITVDHDAVLVEPDEQA